MNALNPWLDADEVRSVSQRLIAPASDIAATIPEVGFDDSFVGFTDLDTPAVRDLTSGHSFAQITKFRDWMREKFSTKGMFIVDLEGLVIFDEGDLKNLHFLAQSLMLAPRRPDTSDNVRVQISSNNVLELISLEASNGPIVLGALIPRALTPEAVEEIIAALKPPISS